MSVEWRISARANLHSGADFKKPGPWQYICTFRHLSFAEEYIKAKGNRQNVYQIERWVKEHDSKNWILEVKQRKQDNYDNVPYVEKELKNNQMEVKILWQ